MRDEDFSMQRAGQEPGIVGARDLPIRAHRGRRIHSLQGGTYGERHLNLPAGNLSGLPGRTLVVALLTQYSASGDTAPVEM